eukprot:357541-Amphidinium_carterae.2
MRQTFTLLAKEGERIPHTRSLNCNASRLHPARGPCVPLREVEQWITSLVREHSCSAIAQAHSLNPVSCRAIESNKQNHMKSVSSERLGAPRLGASNDLDNIGEPYVNTERCTGSSGQGGILACQGTALNKLRSQSCLYSVEEIEGGQTKLPHHAHDGQKQRVSESGNVTIGSLKPAKPTCGYCFAPSLKTVVLMVAIGRWFVPKESGLSAQQDNDVVLLWERSSS